MMDYEKAYKDALERAKKMLASKRSLMVSKQALETLFPELAESEDERIRKELIEFIEWAEGPGSMRSDFHQAKRPAEWIAWLEKQKEQKPVEWSEGFEDNIRILLQDKLTWHSEDGSMSSTVFIDDKTLKDIINGIWFYVGKEALKHPNKELKMSEWSEKHIADIFEKVGLAKIAREQGNDALTNAVQSAMIELSKTKPAEWSEEDEIRLKEALEVLNESIKHLPLGYGYTKDVKLVTDWLKSLRPSWKPTEEQIYSLGTVVKGYNECTVGSVGYNLKELYEQLKAL